MSERDFVSALLDDARRVVSTIQSTRSIRVKPTHPLAETVREFIKAYFRTYQIPLRQVGIPTNGLDEKMQALLRKTNSYTTKRTYKESITEIRNEIQEIQVFFESIQGERAQSLAYHTQTSQQDQIILETLKKAIPSAAQSYTQVLLDLQTKRVSYRGTAAELRETLREVLNYLAPDKDVAGAPGFVLEVGAKKPTMKQKVRFILKSRDLPTTAIEVPENAAAIVDDSVGSLTRSLYGRGSTTTHLGGQGRPEILQMKMYLDSVLCELLAIHRLKCS